MDIYHEILLKYWGYTSFRDIQENIIHAVVGCKDTLGLMPTGGGKSLTFQVPVLGMEGLCIVITPLIALMKDQVDNLKKRNIKALAVYSGMTRHEINIAFENAIYGDYKFLYISPERLVTDLFLSKLKHMKVCLLVVDEAHCISQWGYDFRPSYLKIASLRDVLPLVPVLALTATATATVVNDIQEKLNFKERNVIKQSFERKNLAYVVRQSEAKLEDLVKILQKIPKSGLIYVRSQKKTKEIADYLLLHRISADYYHAGLSRQTKERKQSAWTNGEIQVMVCTNAFGMGIDKPDVRIVVHLDLPNSIEEYFQEAGRAGRDGKKSFAVILTNDADKQKLLKRIKNEFPERNFIFKIYEYLCYFFQVADGSGFGQTFPFEIHKFCTTYKLPLLPTYNALKILSMAGYLEYIEEITNTSKLHFIIHRDDLYNYSLNSENEILINTILRLYTGLFADYVSINEDQIATRMHKTKHDVYQMLRALAQYNILDYIPHKKIPLIAFMYPRIDSKYLNIPKSIYEDRRQKLSDHLDAMINYVGSDTCRSRLLLSYFGETDATDCGICDVCLASKKLKASIYDDIQYDILIILEFGSLSVSQIVENLSVKYTANHILETIAFLVNHKKLKQIDDKIQIYDNK